MTVTKKKKMLTMKFHAKMSKKEAFLSNELQLQKLSLTSIHKNKPLLSATSILSHSPMAHNTTVSLDNLTCTDYVDFGKCSDKFRQLSSSKNDSNYLDLKHKFFRKDDNKVFRLVQNLTMGEAGFNRFMQLSYQLVIATKKLARRENLFPVVLPTLSIRKGERVFLMNYWSDFRIKISIRSGITVIW